jgi:pimeloyl-ACP methyl ester carboxylesterase
MPLPYAEVQFTTKGDAADDTELIAAIDMACAAKATDVLVITHGWNNDMPKAREMFDKFKDHLDRMLGSSSGLTLAVIGVLWPSIRWADEEHIAGGGAFVDEPGVALHAAIDEIATDASVPSPIAMKLHDAANRLERPDAREEFVTALRSLLPVERYRDEDPIPATLATGDANELFAAAAEALDEDEDEEADEEADTSAYDPIGAGGWFPEAPVTAPTVAAGLGQWSPKAIAYALLNLTTYYMMRDRALTVGEQGVANLVDRLHTAAPEVRIHLAGHSFGAKVMSAAAAETGSPIHSITLLQGAFSHYGFTANYNGSGKDGAFRSVLTGGHLQGPVVVTHTYNDKVVKWSYAIASRLARQVGAVIGGRRDPYGGIGANGALALATSEVGSTQELKGVGFNYQFQPSRVYNLRADRHIPRHSAVTGEPVAYALLSALRASGIRGPRMKR